MIGIFIIIFAHLLITILLPSFDSISYFIGFMLSYFLFEYYTPWAAKKTAIDLKEECREEEED
jgi:hypothetical protein